MPISSELLEHGSVIHTVLRGRVTDDELLAYYRRELLRDGLPNPWRELVNGTAITDMAITLKGQQNLAKLISQHLDRLSGGRVAMVAISDVVYGMFRMWEMQRETLGYDVVVFKDLREALVWVSTSDA